MGKTDEVLASQTKLLRSGFGKQVKSPHSTNPSWGFGTSSRDAAIKMYLSPEHARVVPGNNSQGPVYKNASSLGGQVDSKLLSAATFSFGTSARLSAHGRSAVPGPGAYRSTAAIGEQKESKRSTSPRTMFGTSTRDAQQKVFLDDQLMKTYYGKESPGPMVYNVPGSVGKQMDSKRESSPAWRQGTAPRFSYETKTKEVPGAGQYALPGGVGRQVLSKKKTQPVFSFGTSTRDAAKKTFISKEHEKASYGDNTPGPITAEALAAMGRQTLSNRATSPGWGFGTSKRDQGYMVDVPGPGTYWA